MIVILEIGSVIDGKYKILHVIGRGGMSIVYLALNERAGKQWAIKLIDKSGENNKLLEEGILTELSVLRGLKNKHLPEIVDVIDYEASFLIVMDYVEGRTLLDLIEEREVFSEEEVLDIAIQLCEVIGFLHEKGIIYRDLKPANIMLKPDGTIVLIDFGTAREFKTNKNRDTVYLGTKGYAAPEQYGDRGQTDQRTDIYCLGASLYHLITGIDPSKPPYEMGKIRELNPLLSRGAEYIIGKCTRLNPEERYQNCDELIYDIEHIKEFEEGYGKNQLKKSSRFLVMSILTLIFALATGFCRTREVYLDRAHYENLVEQAENSRLLSSKEKYYIAAVSLHPDLYSAYDSMLSELADQDRDFSSEEAALVSNVIYSQWKGLASIDYLKQQHPKAYAKLCYHLGTTYFFMYSGDGGKKISVAWFRNFLKINPDPSDSKKLRRAEIYCQIGEYYDHLGLNRDEIKGEDQEGSYAAFFEDLKNLNQYEPNDLGKTNTAIILYQEIVNQIEGKMLKFLRDGVTLQQIESEIEQVEKRMKSLSQISSSRSLKYLKMSITQLEERIAEEQALQKKIKE